MATREELAQRELRGRKKKASVAKVEPILASEPVVTGVDNHEPEPQLAREVLRQETKPWSEPKPQPQEGTTDFARLDCVKLIAMPHPDRLGEMSRIPTGMVMRMILLRFQQDVVLSPDRHPAEWLAQRIYEGFRGRDGLLIKDIQKLFDTESEKSINTPSGLLGR